MKLFIGLILILSSIVAFRTLSRQRAAGVVAADNATAIAGNHDAVPVVVELFTSEGCSSCPPADEVLAKLDQTQPIQGVEIIALGEHVDYWNQLGWADPYSSAKFSKRQSEYADAFNHDGVYTPQMIVDGREEFAGGSMDRARSAIAAAAKFAKANVKIGLSQDAGSPKSGAVKISVRVRDLPRLTEGDSAEVLLAITENNLSSAVARGENAGRYLRHSAVVRELTYLGHISAGQDFAMEPMVNLGNGWQRNNLRVVVFLQERSTRRVLGAAAFGLSAKMRAAEDE
jgi:hypothetical protein